MKTTWKVALLAVTAFFVMGTGVAGAQQKFGYINSQELIPAMPEAEAITKQLEELQQELMKQYETMRTEFATKSEEYRTGANAMAETVRKQKEKDLDDLSSRFQEFQQNAQEELQAKQSELLQPVLQKAREAIEKVGKAQGLAGIFDLSSGALIYQNESAMVDVLPLVKKELGITK